MYGHAWKVEDVKNDPLERSDVKAVTGAFPAIVGFDLGGIEMGWDANLDGVSFDLMRRAAVTHAARGGVVTFSWHPRNPLTGGDAWDVSSDQVVASILEGGEKHDLFLQWLGRAADFLETLKDADGQPVAVLFRPWHEHTGSWFWWGGNLCSEQQYKDLFRLRGQLERLREKLSERTAYVQSEYSLTEEGARQFYREDLGKPAQMRKEIEQRKSKIRGLGNVNVNAIEDYRVTNERYVFLKGQHEDLKKAEASLVQVITELDQGMRRQFSREFGRIAEQFNLVFRDLFGGGKGELKLEEGADILEASISIIAQPPGKKLQNMMQLSGGEKALTAISLLFAIQNLKPSPFALLDEIEAALDDSNVDRYAQYLKKLTVNTQFIVITHRRGTMVGADRLYGITMQEKGVSTLVSVSLIEDKLDQ